ncbi:type IV pilus biogenesis/stability protein PilW [Massilia sp. TW-1]|uniref:Type IV pilus biogenesis/stability protein PilW n=1 Tax=Telluria antibiotica TaxID=2717319 RepID=A0ABX0PKE8_9BURK|nr:type IV pilus biogenesis/stability protein PilW [Telluria antibiotica]NIA57935.1 type IV pilus biogenesis/stability protein PilW [Telluria antibiotica]
MPRLPGRLACALAIPLLLSACAGTGRGMEGETHELKTLSDQTAAEKRAQIRLQLAVGYYQEAKYDVALDEVKQAIVANPEYADAYGVRALIYTAMGENVLADDNYRHALRLAPRNPDLANNYGLFLCGAGGKPRDAMAYFDAALKNPNYATPVKAMVNAGNCSLKLKNADAAERYLLDALRYDPDLTATNAGLARVYFERRDYSRAGFFINRLTETAKLDTLSADVLWLAIRVKHMLGDRTTEASLAAQLRKRFPGSPEYAAFERGAFSE